MPAPTQTDTTWQVQTLTPFAAGPGKYNWGNLGGVQTNFDTALALANANAGGTPARVMGLQSGNLVEVFDGAG